MYYSPPTEVQQGATPSASKTLRAHLNQFSFGRCPAIFIFINSLHYHRFSVPPPHVVMVGDIPSLLHMFPANPVPLSGPNRLPILIGFINYLYYTSSTVPPPRMKFAREDCWYCAFNVLHAPSGIGFIGITFFINNFHYPCRNKSITGLPPTYALIKLVLPIL